MRVTTCLRNHGFTWNEQDSDSNETRVLTFAEVLAQAAAGRRTSENLINCHDDAQASRSETSPRPLHCDGAVNLCGFALHVFA